MPAVRAFARSLPFVQNCQFSNSEYQCAVLARTNNFMRSYCKLISDSCILGTIQATPRSSWSHRPGGRALYTGRCSIGDTHIMGSAALGEAIKGITHWAMNEGRVT